MQCYNTLFFNFLSIICQVVTYKGLKMFKNRILPLKVVAVAVNAYEEQLLTPGSKHPYSDLTWKLLVF